MRDSQGFCQSKRLRSTGPFGKKYQMSKQRYTSKEATKSNLFDMANSAAVSRTSSVMGSMNVKNFIEHSTVQS